MFTSLLKELACRMECKASTSNSMEVICKNLDHYMAPSSVIQFAVAVMGIGGGLAIVQVSLELDL